MISKHRQADLNGRKVLSRYLSRYFIITYTEDDFNPVDFNLAARANSAKTYVGDIKAYLNKNNPRYSYKFPNYQVDYNKLREIKKAALNSKATPLLVGIFTDKVIVWDLNKSKWESTATWVPVNKDGMSYGEKKEIELQAYLYFTDAVYAIDREEGDYEE